MLTRRDLLKTAAGASLFTIVPAGVLRGETAPSNQLTRALIGFGCIASKISSVLYPLPKSSNAIST